MKHEKISPCASCPYRRDAKLGFWDAEHFHELLRNDADPINGKMYNCHEDGKKPLAEREFCVGWLLDQKRRREPSIQLRLKLMTSGAAARQYAKISTNGVRLFKSLTLMCATNLRAIQAMRRKSTR